MRSNAEHAETRSYAENNNTNNNTFIRSDFGSGNFPCEPLPLCVLCVEADRNWKQARRQRGVSNQESNQSPGALVRQTRHSTECRQISPPATILLDQRDHMESDGERNALTENLIEYRVRANPVARMDQRDVRLLLSRMKLAVAEQRMSQRIEGIGRARSREINQVAIPDWRVKGQRNVDRADSRQPKRERLPVVNFVFPAERDMGSNEFELGGIETGAERLHLVAMRRRQVQRRLASNGHEGCSGYCTPSKVTSNTSVALGGIPAPGDALP